jgi:hypothetical protein
MPREGHFTRLESAHRFTLTDMQRPGLKKFTSFKCKCHFKESENDLDRHVSRGRVFNNHSNAIWMVLNCLRKWKKLKEAESENKGIIIQIAYERHSTLWESEINLDQQICKTWVFKQSLIIQMAFEGHLTLWENDMV